MHRTTNWPEPECNAPRPAPWVPAAPHRPPWQQLPPVPVHVAKTVTVACGPGLLRAADPPPRD
jgi:hypothetical protein